jgi:hypothetical protein
MKYAEMQQQSCNSTTAQKLYYDHKDKNGSIHHYSKDTDVSLQC